MQREQLETHPPQHPPLVVIAGLGGISAAGRSSGHQAFRRIVFDALNGDKQASTIKALQQLSGHSELSTEELLAHSLIREWDRKWDKLPWNPDAVPFHKAFKDEHGNQCWRLESKRLNVRSAAQLPLGFDPAKQYPSPGQAKHHPRGLQMAVYGASDALGSMGIKWEVICDHLSPDQIGVYASSAMGQLDSDGHGGMLQAPLVGKRTSSKQCPLGLAEMTADFINAYVLGNVGATGANVGACATFLYNLKAGTDDIRSGKRRLVMIGTSEAPLVPEIIEGYNAMTALATEEKLRQLDNLQDKEKPDYQKASRPFGNNVGFTLAESSQFVVLCDAQLALELGLNIYGAVGETFIHADGHKKSISGPGIGNYITMGKAMAEAQRWFGKEALTQGSFVQAHGSSTPQNRTTESEIYSRLAKAFEIKDWPITAVKAHLGHSLASASADQLFTTLGCWAEGLLPGITSTTEIADDVHSENLNYLLQHQQFDPQDKPIAFLNSKGFGGNNASSFIISPQKTHELLEQSTDSEQWNSYLNRNEVIRKASSEYDQQMSEGKIKPRYLFGENVLEPEDLKITGSEIWLKGWKESIKL